MVSRRGLLGEASSPSRPTSANTSIAFDETEVRLQSSSDLHLSPGDGLSFWKSVGPKLRVLPLTPQAAFALQSGDAVFSPPEAGGFVRLCRPDPLPVSAFPFRVPDCESGPSGEVVSPGNGFDVLAPSSIHDLLGHWVHRPGRNHMPWAMSLESRRGFYSFAALRLTLRSHARARCDPARESG